MLPHLRRDLEALVYVAEKYRAQGSAMADLVDGDIAAVAARIVEVEREEGGAR